MNNKTFYKNTISLYLLRISYYLFSFITVPLQTRVLGPSIYALLAFSLTFSQYFQVFVEFGFNLSATEKISKNKDDKLFVNTMISKVLYSRILLFIISLFIFLILIFIFPEFKKNVLILFIYFISAVVVAFLPDFLFMGLEQMQFITYKSVISRAVFTVLLFMFLRNASLFYLVPIFSIMGNLLALFFICNYITNKLGYKLIKIPIRDIINEIKWSSQFFFSQLSNSLYNTINTLTIGLVYGSNSVDLGLFKTADQSIFMGKQVIMPITDSLFPYMAKNKDFSLFKKIFILGTVIIIIGTIFVDIYARELCGIIFGEKFIESSLYLRLLSPSVLFAFWTMMFGYPLLSAIGKISYANYSIIFSSIFQLVVLFVLLLTNKLNIVNLCILTCISELLIFVFRLVVVLKYISNE